eukprot:Skav227568  [mRNA]  locus=scaffold154:117578:118015:+ [translate_table: standard]
MQAEVTPKAKAAQARRGRVVAAAVAGRLDVVPVTALRSILLGPQPIVPVPPEVNLAGSGSEAVAMPPQVEASADNGQANEGHNGTNTCMIRLEDMNHADQITFLECGHKLHSECIRNWMERSGPPRPFSEACPLKCWQSAVTVDE